MNAPKDLSKIKVCVTLVEHTEPGDPNPFGVGELDGKTELEPIVDADLDRFSQFYATTLKNSGLSGYERAVLKTYIYWKTHPEK